MLSNRANGLFGIALLGLSLMLSSLLIGGCSNDASSENAKQLKKDFTENIKESDQLAIDVAIWQYAGLSSLTQCELAPETSLYKRMEKYFNENSKTTTSFGQLQLIAQGGNNGLPSGYLIKVKPGAKVTYSGKLSAEVEFIEGQIGLTPLFKNKGSSVSYDFKSFVADGSKCKVNGALLVFGSGVWKQVRDR
jgi:hypothetical protein